METYLNGIDNGTATVLIDIEKDEFDKAKSQVYQKTKQYYNIKGFRKGKVPRKLIEDHYGKDVFDDDAIELIVNENLDNIFDEIEHEPISAPVITNYEDVEDGGIEITITFLVEPEPKLANYSEYTLTELAPVTDEDIDAELALQYKEFYDTEDEAQIDDKFVQEISDFNTVDEYKEFTKDLLKKEHAQQRSIISRDKLINDFFNDSVVEFPEEFIEERKTNLSPRNVKLEETLKNYNILPIDTESLYLEFLKRGMILSKFIKEENIPESERERALQFLSQGGMINFMQLQKDDPEHANLIMNYLIDMLLTSSKLFEIARLNTEKEDGVDA